MTDLLLVSAGGFLFGGALHSGEPSQMAAGVLIAIAGASFNMGRSA